MIWRLFRWLGSRASSSLHSRSSSPPSRTGEVYTTPGGISVVELGGEPTVQLAIMLDTWMTMGATQPPEKGV